MANYSKHEILATVNIGKERKKAFKAIGVLMDLIMTEMTRQAVDLFIEKYGKKPAEKPKKKKAKA